MLLPEPVLLVTAGVDVQLRYLAVLTMGWAPDAEAWVLDWQTVEGDPRDPMLLLSFVQELAALRLEHPTAGQVPIHLAGIDSGFATDCVYRAPAAAPRRGGKWCYATKGVGGRSGEPVVLPIQDRRDLAGHRGPRPLPINTDGAKAELMAALKTTTPGRGYWHLPRRVGPDFVKQLTAEEERTKYNRDGVVIGTEWVKAPDARNEAMDCACINLALFHHMRPAQWLQLLTARYGQDDGIERFRPLYPTQRIHGVDDAARTPPPLRDWLERSPR